MPRLPNIPSLSGDDYRLLVDSIVDYAIFMLDVNGRVVSWNLGAEKIKGYQAEEILGEHFSKFYTAEDIAAGKPERELETAAEQGRVEDDGWRVRKGGGLFWATVVITALRDERGVLRGYGKVTRDLTKRRIAEQELHRSEQRFHDLVDAVTDYAMFMLDPSGRVQTWNAGAQKAKGYTASEIIGQHFSVFYGEDDRQAGKPARMLERARLEGRVEDESWRVRKDGTRFLANVIITALRDHAGRITGYVKVTRDLTERWRAEEELRRSEERFRLLIESVTDYAIYMLDPQGRVTTWNLGAERMKGYAAAEIIGTHFTVFFPAEDVRNGKPERELETARQHGRFEDEGWRVRKDGSRFWASVVVTSMADAHGQFLGYAKITRDLTARRLAEETARRLSREQAAREMAEQLARHAEEASRLKDEFLATVSHELRTPLNAIVGWSSLLRSRNVDPALAKGVDVIHRNAQAQGKIIDDILDVSRIITGNLRLELEPTDVTGIIRDALEVVRPSAAAKDITLELAPRSDSAVVVADAQRLQQVVWNLLSNAVKFTDAGGKVRIEVHTTSSTLEIAVKDTGVGISPEFLPYVFDRFKQADGSTTRRVGGLGLGLAIVRHLVELHGGRVAATSEGLGKGSTFTIRLPTRATATHASRTQAAATALPARTSPPATALDGLRVVVVDDEPDARELIHMLLVEAGATVETVASAAEAFELVQRVRPHVLISDIGMPDEDGYGFMKRVRALDPSLGGGIPSIALTAYTRPQDRTKALSVGFTTHIGKPVNPDDLLAAVENLARLSPRQ